MNYNALPKKTLGLWLTRGALCALLALGGYMAALLLCEAGASRAAAALVGTPLLLLSLFLSLGLPSLRYRFYTYGYDEKRIVVRRGVIFRRSIVIPLYQIQDLVKTEGPLMMLFGLSGVCLSTAGSSFLLATLREKEAEAMICALEEAAAVRFEENRDEAL